MTIFNPTEFWRNPDINEVDIVDYRSHYLPPYYINKPEITAELIDVFQRYVGHQQSIMELGCNVGRNLAALKACGYQSLSGIEINPNAVELGRKTFNLDGIAISIGSIEDLIDRLDSYDCIFTQSVLMHLPPSSEWVFEKIADKTNDILITRENEIHTGKFQWMRDYDKIFTGLGLKQIEYKPTNHKVKLRVFRK